MIAINRLLIVPLIVFSAKWKYLSTIDQVNMSLNIPQDISGCRNKIICT